MGAVMLSDEPPWCATCYQLRNEMIRCFVEPTFNQSIIRISIEFVRSNSYVFAS